MKKADATSNKQVALNMTANIVSYTANIIISFALTPFLICAIGKETYSFYPIANTFVSYMSILTTALNSMASRFVTISLVKGDKKNANKYYSSVFFANTIMDAVMLIPMIVIVVALDRFMDIPINSVAAVKQLFAFVFAAMLINIIGSIYGIATFAKNRIDLRSLLDLVTAILKLILFYVFYKYLPPSIAYVGVVTLVIAFVGVAFQRHYTKMLLPEIHISRKNFSWPHTKELLASSVWNSINSLGNGLLAGMSLILANLLYGSWASGEYSIVQTVPIFISGVITMLSGVFYPVITYRYAQNDQPGLINEIIKSQNLIGSVSCAVISVFMALGTEFFTLWVPGEDAHYLEVLSVITILPHFVIACVWSLTNMNIVMNKVKIPALYTLGCGIANVALAYLTYLMYKPGVVSLPIISSALQILWVGIFIPLYVSYNLKLKWTTFYPSVVYAIICSILTIVETVVIKSFFNISSWFNFFLVAIITGIIALVIFSIGMVGIGKIKKIVFKVIRRDR